MESDKKNNLKKPQSEVSHTISRKPEEDSRNKKINSSPKSSKANDTNGQAGDGRSVSMADKTHKSPSSPQDISTKKKVLNKEGLITNDESDYPDIE